MAPGDCVSDATQQLEFRLVDAQNAPVRPHPEQSQGRFREEIGQLLFPPAEGYLGLLSGGDVPDDAASHGPAFKHEGAARDFDREDSPIPFPVVTQRNAGCRAGERKLDRRFGILSLGGDRRVGKAEEFFTRVAIKAERGFVDLHELPGIRIKYKGGVRDGFEKPAILRFAFRQRAVGSLEFAVRSRTRCSSVSHTSRRCASGTSRDLWERLFIVARLPLGWGCFRRRAPVPPARRQRASDSIPWLPVLQGPRTGN